MPVMTSPSVTLVSLDIGYDQHIQRPFAADGDLFGRIARWVRRLGVPATRGTIAAQAQTIGDAIEAELTDVLRRDNHASHGEMIRAAAWAARVWSVEQDRDLPADWSDIAEAYVADVLRERSEDRAVAETLAGARRAGMRGGW